MELSRAAAIRRPVGEGRSRRAALGVVALRLTLSGSHHGEFQGIPATGRTISYVSHEFYRVADDQIAEEWICSDIASLFAQLS